MQITFCVLNLYKYLVKDQGLITREPAVSPNGDRTYRLQLKT